MGRIIVDQKDIVEKQKRIMELQKLKIEKQARTIKKQFYSIWELEMNELRSSRPQAQDRVEACEAPGRIFQTNYSVFVTSEIWDPPY